MRLPTLPPRMLTSTGATTTSGTEDGGEYSGGVPGVGDLDDDDDESEGVSEGESNDPRERLTAGGGRAMRMSSARP
jgi:hypothetical protein